jgi:acyl transferase domain-containing protein
MASQKDKVSAPEPIALIGIGCRYAGIRDVESFWRALTAGHDMLEPYPGGRFPYVDQVYAAQGPLSGRIASARGGFLHQLDQFDPAFFGISPREATLLDPQQRVLLEITWEAIDDAGLRRDQIAGRHTGVFVGLWTSDYEACVNDASDGGDLYATTGTGRYSASGRLAYVLDARGPNLTLDTACSSSMVAIHLACQSLRSGESRLAIAGGANVILRPEITLAYSAARMLSPEGRLKFADARADGYVRGEGAGVVILKPLSAALADGDPIYAVIRGSAVNNDGRSSGLLVAPGQGGQEEVFQAALDQAGVSAAELDYVEAHGTGTPRGDPVELSAIGEVLRRAPREQACLVGSVKTNIGHTEAAAGVAGVIKVALSLQHRTIPASLHCETLTTRVDWDRYPLTIATREVAWPERGHAPLAGVRSFGITGTNADAVLEAAPVREVVPTATPPGRPLVFLLSGHTPAALTAVAQSWRDRLTTDAAWPASLTDLAYTAAVRRTQHDVRLAVVATSKAALADRLTDWIDGTERTGVVSGRRLPYTPSKAVFVYPGQGGQWTGMGRGLYATEPVFRDALVRCDAAIRALVGWSVVDMLLHDEHADRLAEHDVMQPTLFALAFALTELWRSFGVEPAAVIGHSLGEVAAAAATGALSLDDAAAVACHRSRLMKQVVGKGMMALVELPMDEVRELIANAGNLWIGASNGATSTVISGDVDAVEAMLRTLEAREVFCRRVRTDVASHSGHMDGARNELEQALRATRPRQGRIPMYSTATGEIEDGTRLDAAYWGRNLRETVLFYPALQRLLEDGFDTFVEVNVHPVLAHSLQDAIQRSERDAVVAVSMRRETDEQTSFLAGVSTLHVAGYPVDTTKLVPHGSHMRLPTYPWQRERYWFEPSAAPLLRNAAGTQRAGASRHTSVDPASRLFAGRWTDMSVETSAPQRERRHWIVLANEGLGERFVRTLTATGDTCTVVRAGKTARAIDDHTYTVDPTSDRDLRAIFERELDRSAGVIHAWALSDQREEPTLEALWDAQRDGCFSAASVVRAIAGLQRPTPTRLWLLTNGAQMAGEGDVPSVPIHGALLGLGRSIAQTHPELPCTNVDVSRDATEDELVRAVRVMRADTTEQQVAIRGERALKARYERATARRGTPPRIRGDATYLLTGGLGGIGLHVARWLVANGARHLALVGRRAPSDEARTTLDALVADGAQVVTFAGDVAQPDDVTRLMERVRAELPPVAGVFHLAATVRDVLLPDADTESYRELLRPKMAGAWNLYRALSETSLDFWISFSSVAAVISLPGQGPYAAANAFLDGLARYASARGVPMHSVQWGPWDETGLGTAAGTVRSFEAYAAQGLAPMQPDEGIAMLAEVLGHAEPVVLATPLDVATLLSTSSDLAGVAEFTELSSRQAPPTVSNAPTSSDLTRQLAATPSGRARAAMLENHLREQLSSILKTPAARIDAQQPIGSMGIDSLMALDLVRRLSTSIGVKVPATAVFNYPTIAKLAAALDARLDQQRPRGQVTTPAAGATSSSSKMITTDVQAMSDEDALRALTGASEAGQ